MGDAVQRTYLVAARYGGRRRPCASSRARSAHSMTTALRASVNLVDTIKVRLDDLDGGYFAVSDCVRD